MNKAAIYARVSTEKQEEQRTIESQLFELREAVKRDGVTLFKEYVDDGVSGTVMERPGLDQLRDDASKGLFQAVYIHAPDRLARKYVYQALVLDEFRRRSIEAVFLNKAITDCPEDQLLLGIEGLIAEYERAKILERVRRGKLHWARCGAIVGGNFPYGYAYIRKTKDQPGHYAIDPNEAKVVQLIFQLYLKSSSSTEVVRELARRGIRPRNGGPYWATSVAQGILKGEYYTGTAFYNKIQYERGAKRKTREREQWIPITVPRIVDDDTFHLAQVMLSRSHGGRKIREYLLSGLTWCAHCGSAYVGSRQRVTKAAYYRCNNSRRRFPLPRTCAARQVRADRLEDAVIAALRNAVGQPEALVIRIREWVQRQQSRATDGVVKESSVASLQTLEAKERKAADLYLDGLIAKEEYLERKAALGKERAEVERSLQEVDFEMSQLDDEAIAEAARTLAAQTASKLASLPPVDLRAFLRLLVERLEFDWLKSSARLFVHVPSDLMDGHMMYQNRGVVAQPSRYIIRFEMAIPV